MSKIETDYSNTIIYTIRCLDPSISELYVGHTTNFVQRKQSHKLNCINENNNCKLYTFIRNNGGWDNWDMKIVKFHNCVNIHEARQKEQDMYILLNATLNSVEPFPNKINKQPIFLKNENQSSTKFECNLCNYKCNKQ
jgi:hypothetical protein